MQRENFRMRTSLSCYCAQMRDTVIRFCPNEKCPAHGHVIYTQGTRCGFCRWDLTPARNRREPGGQPFVPTRGHASAKRGSSRISRRAGA